MADTEFGEARFDIGGVVARAFGTIASNFLLFCGLALVLVGIPQIFMQMWQISLRADMIGGSFGFSQSYALMAVAAWLVSMVTGTILQAALTRATVRNLSGETPQFAESLAIGFRLLLPMLALGIIAGIGVGIGFALLIVPGVVLWLVWSVAAPAYVQEKIGIFEAFGRSADLTRGARWRIFLTMLIVIVLLWVLSIPVGFVTAAMSFSGSVSLIALVGAAASAIGTMIIVTTQASIYVELRQLKEGVAPAELEAIFA